MPQTDIHKLVGFICGALAGLGAHYGFNVPDDIVAIIVTGVTLAVSTWIGKHTNPTGANSSEARKALEGQTGTGKGGA
jgi:hypothetical protein